jgi:hypothetical protein
MESARRWSGYVCPDCRFVFRVPRDHDGKGIVCPSCRRLMRIPAAGDTPPLLLAPVRRAGSEELAAPDEMRKQKKRRRGTRGAGTDHSWERNHRGASSGRGEKRQMRMLLAGGGLLLALAVGGVFVAMNRSSSATPAAPPVPPTAAMKPPAAKQPATPAARGDATLLAEAEPLVKKLLTATNVDEILPLVRHPEVSGPRMREFYPDGKILAPGLSKFNSADGLDINGSFISIQNTDSNLDEQLVTLVDTPNGLKIDWESWANWSDISWEDFLRTKPTTSHVFRITLSEVDYYNFDFSDDAKWHSYRLISPVGKKSLYGYALRGSSLDVRLQPTADTSRVNYMLSLVYPPDATSDSQVEIESVVTEGWVLPDPPP